MTVSNEELNALKSNSAVLRIYGNKTKLDKRGKEYIGKCPFHAEKTGSFSVNANRDGFWLYCCFGCGAAGSIIDFVSKTESLSFPQAVEFIRKQIGSTVWEQEKTKVEQVFKPPVDDSKEYKQFTLVQYQKLEEALAASKEAQDWLKKERGINYETAKALHLGYKQDIGKTAYPNTDIADKGWISLPCIDGDKVVQIEYRSISKKAFARQPGMKTTLFNLETIDFLSPVFLVEGKFDAAVLEQAGYRAVSLPNAGYKLTPEQRDALLQAEAIILAGDEDGGAGTKTMERLKADFGERAVRIKWPEGYKDANEVFLKYCKRKIDKFRETVIGLVIESKSQPLPGVYSLVDVMGTPKEEILVDHPDRFRFPWKCVDEMAILMPGSVAFSTATNTGMGKSQFWVNATLSAARKHKEIVLNYQVELTPNEVANIVAAHVLHKDRNSLTKEDYNKAATILKGVRYYVGADTTLTDAQSVLDLIEAAVKRLGATVVVLDHIHFVCRGDNEVQEQAKAMQRIKNMARAYGLKFIVVGQPRKAEQKSKGKLLHISDAKGSETLTADSDVAYFLHREVIKSIDPASPPMDEYEPETEIHLKKARSKGRGAAFAKLYFEGRIATFLDISSVEDIK